MKFSFENLEVNVLNIVSQKPQANANIYSAIKIGIDSIPLSSVCALLGCRTVGELKQSFFKGDELRFNKLSEIPTHREYQGKHMIRFDGMEEMRVTRLYNIDLYPIPGEVFGVQFSFQVEPNAPQLWLLHDMQKRKVTLSLIQDASELLDTDEEEAIAAEEKAKEKDKQQKADSKQQKPTAVESPSAVAH